MSKLDEYARKFISEHIHGSKDFAEFCLKIVFKNHWGHEGQIDGIGFSRWDEKFLTSIAGFTYFNGYLSEKQWACAKRLLPKYWNQIWTACKAQVTVAIQAENDLRDIMRMMSHA